jgi:hypothetical protein
MSDYHRSRQESSEFTNRGVDLAQDWANFFCTSAPLLHSAIITLPITLPITLRRIYEEAKKGYMVFHDFLAMAANPVGIFDRQLINEIIAKQAENDLARAQ